MNRPGEIAGWPKLVVTYTTDPAGVAALLPPGLEPLEPVVTVGFYCVPVLDEPEYGVSVKVAAAWQGVAGQYNLGLGIDQEAAVHVSGETNGQPKFLCDIAYFRFGDRVTARASHQGYTFVEFTGTVDRRGRAPRRRRRRARVVDQVLARHRRRRGRVRLPAARRRRGHDLRAAPRRGRRRRPRAARQPVGPDRAASPRLRARSCPAGHPATDGAPARRTPDRSTPTPSGRSSTSSAAADGPAIAADRGRHDRDATMITTTTTTGPSTGGCHGRDH